MTNKEFKKLKDDLWLAAKKLRADSDLKSNDYSPPVLGIIFLKFADIRYSKFENEIKKEFEKKKKDRNPPSIQDIALAKCKLYIPDTARYNYLKELSVDKDIAAAVVKAMTDIEKNVKSLKDTLPKEEFYAITRKGQTLLKQLLKLFSTIPDDITGDLLGKIYEFFLEKFGLEEAQKGGEFFTPTSVVNLMVEYIEPYHGKIFDPACGSGGMFVQSANFIQRHHLKKGSDYPIKVDGQEKTLQTVNIAKMSLAINGLNGEIVQGDSYSEDYFESFGKYDFVMANPPFNVKEVNEDIVKNDKRFTEYGLPRSKSKTKSAGVVNIPNANYLWISLFATSLNKTGKAALVMANSANDAGNSEYDIRKTLIRKGLISGMLSTPSNLFNSVGLPATIWFFDKSHMIKDFEKEKNKIKILFIDSRNIFHQIERALREYTEEQVQNIAAINHLRKGNQKFFVELVDGHYQNSFQRLPILKGLIGELDKDFHQQLIAFSKWINSLKINKEQQNILKESDFFARLESLKISDTKKASVRLVNLLNDFKAYSNKVNFQKPELANQAQHLLLKDTEPILNDYNTLRKHLTKEFLEFNALYDLADSHLKSKEDRVWKDLKKPKQIEVLIEQINEYSNPAKNKKYENEEKSPFYFFKMAEWLQQRFPKAEYEDVPGLCKLASISEIEEQDYSLNPGRYVGVLIEEDGLTEDEFEFEIDKLNTELEQLSFQGASIAKTIIQKLNFNKNE